MKATTTPISTSPFDRLVAAVEDDRRGPDRRQQLDRREVGGVEVDRAHVRDPVLLVQLRHPLQVPVLAAEAPHDPHPGERLLEVGGDVGDLLPRQPVGAGGDDPEDHAADRQQREGEEGDQRQRHVEREQDHDHAEQRQRAREQRHHAVGHQAVERLHVVGQPRDQHPGPVAGEEPDRHPLEVGVDPLAQVLQAPAARPSRPGRSARRSPPTAPRPRRGRRRRSGSARRGRRRGCRRRSPSRPGRAAPAPPRWRSPARPSSAPPGSGRGAAGRAASAACARAGPRP